MFSVIWVKRELSSSVTVRPLGIPLYVPDLEIFEITPLPTLSDGVPGIGHHLSPGFREDASTSNPNCGADRPNPDVLPLSQSIVRHIPIRDKVKSFTQTNGSEVPVSYRKGLPLAA